MTVPFHLDLTFPFVPQKLLTGKYALLYLALYRSWNFYPAVSGILFLLNPYVLTHSVPLYGINPTSGTVWDRNNRDYYGRQYRSYDSMTQFAALCNEASGYLIYAPRTHSFHERMVAFAWNFCYFLTFPSLTYTGPSHDKSCPVSARFRPDRSLHTNCFAWNSNKTLFTLPNHTSYSGRLESLLCDISHIHLLS